MTWCHKLTLATFEFLSNLQIRLFLWYDFLVKILITGIAGAIGSHLAERLISEGHDVIGIDAFKPYYDPKLKKINAREVESTGAKVYDIDLATGQYEHLLTDVDVIFHLAAQPGISAATPFDTYLHDNLLATHRLIEAAKKIPSLKAFIHASTSSVYGARATGDETSTPQPISHYGVTKLAAEQLALAQHRESGMPIVVLRFFSVYGPRERPDKLYHKLIKAISEGNPLHLHEGSEHHVRSYTFIHDIIEGCVLVLKNLDKAIGQIFNLGTDKTMTTGEGITLIEKIMGKKAEIVRTPRRPGDVLETGANIAKMRDTFGYDPKVELEDGLQAQVEWYMQTIAPKGK